MSPSDPVLIDTCIWVPYFNRPNSSEKQAIDDLLDDDRVCLIGPVLAEVLQGFQREAEADWVASKLRGVRFLDAGWDDWRFAARLGRVAASNGTSLPLTDLVLAAVAMSRELPVFTTDPHFDCFEELQRFNL